VAKALNASVKSADAIPGLCRTFRFRPRDGDSKEEVAQ
jgi:hypothetical protein